MPFLFSLDIKVEVLNKDIFNFIALVYCFRGKRGADISK